MALFCYAYIYVLWIEVHTYVYICRSELHKTRTELAKVQLQYVQACSERENNEKEKKVCIKRLYCDTCVFAFIYFHNLHPYVHFRTLVNNHQTSKMLQREEKTR